MQTKTHFHETGFTLIELSVVLIILIALAALAKPYLSGTSSSALCKATDVTMQNVKKAIMEGYYLDTLGKFPQDLDTTLAVNTPPDYNLHYLFSDKNVAATRIHKAFDPESRTGWRTGGYLQNGIILTSGQNYSAQYLDNSFKDATLPATANDHVNANIIEGNSVVLDGWGRPIILQNSSSGFRLVSAGAGTGIGISDAAIDTKISGLRTGDDRVLYLDVPTPATEINPSCE